MGKHLISDVFQTLLSPLRPPGFFIYFLSHLCVVCIRYQLMMSSSAPTLSKVQIFTPYQE